MQSYLQPLSTKFFWLLELCSSVAQFLVNLMIKKVYCFDEQLVRSENLRVTYQPTGNLWRQEYDLFHSIVIV